MTKNLDIKMEKMQEAINKNVEELKNKHTETNNTITEIKNALEGINSRISEAEANSNFIHQTEYNPKHLGMYI